MPPKRKGESATSAVSGPKAKHSKLTPAFRTPTTSTAGLEATAASEVNSTKNRVVTLRSSASGYRTQDLATTSNSNSASPAAELSDHPPSHISDECDLNSHHTEGGDIHPQADLGAKTRPKQKNTTTVRHI